MENFLEHFQGGSMNSQRFSASLQNEKFENKYFNPPRKSSEWDEKKKKNSAWNRFSFCFLCIAKSNAKGFWILNFIFAFDLFG